jgi:hypothetical protein
MLCLGMKNTAHKGTKKKNKCEEKTYLFSLMWKNFTTKQCKMQENKNIFLILQRLISPK